MSGMRQTVVGTGNMNSVGYWASCGGYGKHEQCRVWDKLWRVRETRTVSGTGQTVAGTGNMNSVGNETDCGGYGKHEQCRVRDKLWHVRET